MKVTMTHKIGFFDVDGDQTLRVQAAARFFQEMATLQALQVGAGADLLLGRGVMWFLNRLEMAFIRFPGLGEKLKITTWSRGFRHHMGFREYRLDTDQGPVAKGSAVWIFYDFIGKRIIKVPPDIKSLYPVCPEKGFETELRDWQPCGKIEPENEISISLRYGDFDVNGHVNNTHYLEFVETLFHKRLGPEKQRVQKVKIRFLREISPQVERIRTGWKKSGSLYQFNIDDPHDPGGIFADGEIIPMADPGIG